jgi:hypothetical protein
MVLRLPGYETAALPDLRYVYHCRAPGAISAAWRQKAPVPSGVPRPVGAL